MVIYLQKFMRTDLTFERGRIPDFADKGTESFYELWLVIQLLEHEEIADRWNVGQNLDHHVHIVVRLDVIQSDKSYNVDDPV